MRKKERGKISQDRFNKQNPYAHIDGEGELSALVDYEIDPADLRAGDFQGKYSDADIKLIVRKLHTNFWRNKDSIWGDRVKNLKPNDMLDPKLAIKLMGFKIGYHKSLGHLSAHNDGQKVAAVINKNEKLVHLSDEFDGNVQNFMLAHELGHLVMHPNAKMHKDVPTTGGVLRSGSEREADIFASYFLMPDRLLKQLFSDYFDLDTQILPALASSLGLDYVNPSRRSRSRLLAATTKYKHKHFKLSLAGLFNVSIEAMAIRLEQLGLVE